MGYAVANWVALFAEAAVHVPRHLVLTSVLTLVSLASPARSRAVLGEENKEHADPTEKLFEVQRDHYYQAHTYKHTTMGFIADIEDMPNEYEYSKLFFERWYRPQYTTVVIAGDVTPEDVFPR